MPPVSPPLEDRHRTKPTRFGPFAATALTVPIVSVTILPLSLMYQLGRRVLKPLLGSGKQEEISIDSGYQVDPSQIIPHSDRSYDVVILGATGFTGYLAARYLAETYGTAKDVKWAIAGRSQEKLDQVKQRLATELKNDDLLKIPTILVDTSVPATLPALVSQTRSVATTAGPYTLYGSHVVEFCAKFGTHYVDITGEVDWVKAMVMKWQETAQKTGAKMISFCGHDSIPWDLCVMKLQHELRERCGDDLKTVTFWDEVKNAAPGGTYATIVNALDDKSIKTERGPFDPFLRLPDGTKSAFVTKVQNPTFISPSKSPWDAGKQRWTAPFVMAGVNGQVARWSHALRQDGNPALTMTYREMQVYHDFQGAFMGFFGLFTFGTLMLNPLTSSIMKRYVLPKVGSGPSMDTMLNKHYLCIYGEGIGAKGNIAECTMYFPRNVGCLDTSRMLVESALCLVKDESKVPEKGGGFWTPSTGMGQPLLDRIIKTGTHFSARVVKREEISKSKL